MNGNETDIRNHYSEQFCDGRIVSFAELFSTFYDLNET